VSVLFLRFVVEMVRDWMLIGEQDEDVYRPGNGEQGGFEGYRGEHDWRFRVCAKAGRGLSLHVSWP
jgi:hypothetical protein